MKGSLTIARLAGVPLRLHWSFPLLFVLVAVSYAGSGVRALGLGLLWLVVVFVSVTIHEVGHAVVARRRGLVVRDIVLLPIGGVSEIAGLGVDATDEVQVALAGPVSSVLLAGLLAVVGLVTGQALWPPTLFAGSWVARLMWANLLLAGFNLLPALPLDGGRVLEGALARRRGQPGGTVMAAKVTRVVALLMIVAGLFVTFSIGMWIVVIGIFVLFAASGEERRAVGRARLGALVVRDVMILERPVPAQTAVADVAVPGRHDPGRALPVVDSRGYLGIVTLGEIDRAAPTSVVGELADTGAPLLQETTRLYPEAVVAFERSGRQSRAAARQREPTGVVYLADLDRVTLRADKALPAASRG